MADWFDSIPGAYQRNVGRMLKGAEFSCGDLDVTVDHIVETVVGFDTAGLFTGITVADTDGLQWTLFNDGTVENAGGDTVGRHELNGRTLKEAA